VVVTKSTKTLSKKKVVWEVESHFPVGGWPVGVGAKSKKILGGKRKGGGSGNQIG